MLEVKTYIINKGTPSQYYGLMTAREGNVLHYAPNKWKTKKGALRWAENHGLKVNEER